MNISYDTITNVFLSKITEFELLKITEETRTNIVDGYMKRVIPEFQHICEYNLTEYDDETRMFTDDFDEKDIDEIVNIVSEGMLVEWLKPYLYRQDLLENAMNTKDFSTYSPAELLLRVGDAYKQAKSNYTQMLREYSYNHNNLSELHL